MTATAPTVLVVDDEEDLREAMRRMLERRGFATLTAADPAEAEAVCRDHGGTIDLLLTDLTLPGASGGDLARTATLMRPDLRVLYISGLPKEVAVGRGLVAEEAALVQKPFTSDRLAEAVRRVLALATP
ncbi:MAG: response regulator [Actinobacteria bacterium 13_2_20CM_2_72_6]|nr:MAG: response regulator [Actinobacteria bacterium 13_2_20CM_2_72_6]